ncbi:MAG TPA: DNA primase small subunit domain-containing protein [Acidimicrobiia bacterium]
MPSETTVEVGEEKVRISSPDKLLFPRQGWTKLDVVNHFVQVAKGALRAVFGRPTMLKRYMESVEVDPIYHKRAEPNSPFETVEVKFPSQRPGLMNVPRTEVDVVRLIQRGCLDLHPWPVRAEDTDHPDELRFDLDPTPGFTFEHVREAATGLRQVLTEAGLVGWPKTSGSRGIHVYVRIEPKWDFFQTRRSVLAAARELERRMTGLVTTSWWKEERTGVFIDYNQNARDKTVSAAYGVRPTGFVSTPFRWEEIEEITIERFPLDGFAERYEEVGDLTDGIDRAPGRIETLLQWVTRDQEEYGQGDAPWPPQYPKVAGEPTRVQPSRKRHDVDTETSAPLGAHYTIEQFLADKGGKKFWDGLVDLARRCGPFEFAAGKTRSAFLVRGRFLTVYTLSDRGVSFWLSMSSGQEHPRIRKVFQVGPHEWVHDVRVDKIGELDDELGELICLAYEWGLTGEK